jgi:hypothetical protein
MFDQDLAGDGSGEAFAGKRLRMFRSLAAKNLAHGDAARKKFQRLITASGTF